MIIKDGIYFGYPYVLPIGMIISYYMPMVWLNHNETMVKLNESKAKLKFL